MNDYAGIIFGVIIGVIVIALIFREFWCWYWKLNKLVALHEQQLNLLKILVKNAKNSVQTDENSVVPDSLVVE